MSDQPSRAGKSTRRLASRRRQWAACMTLIGIVGFIVIILLLKNWKAAGITGAGVLVLLILLYTLPDLIEGNVDRKLKEEKRAIRGAQAEQEIGETLAALSADYYVLNDVFCPYGNIDHIVISKYGGIFLIETKSHHGKVEVNGNTLLVNGKIPEKDFIAQALRNMFWLRDEISPIVGSKPWINPILVFTNAFVPPTRQVRGVSIVNKEFLLNVLHASNRSNPVNAQVWEQREKIGDKLIG